MDLKDIDAFALGYETGNYDSSYVCARPDRKKLAGKGPHYWAGYVLGFFSSFELREVPQKWENEVRYFRRIAEERYGSMDE